MNALAALCLVFDPNFGSLCWDTRSPGGKFDFLLGFEKPLPIPDSDVLFVTVDCEWKERTKTLTEHGITVMDPQRFKGVTHMPMLLDGEIQWTTTMFEYRNEYVTSACHCCGMSTDHPLD